MSQGLNNLIHKQRQHTERGFTLLEVLAAVVILGLAYVAVLESFSVSLGNIEKVDKSRSESFSGQIAFSRDIKFTGGDAFAEQAEGIIFIQGEKYSLIEVSNDAGDMTTLKLQKVL